MQNFIQKDPLLLESHPHLQQGTCEKQPGEHWRETRVPASARGSSLLLPSWDAPLPKNSAQQDPGTLLEGEKTCSVNKDLVTSAQEVTLKEVLTLSSPTPDLSPRLSGPSHLRTHPSAQLEACTHSGHA